MRASELAHICDLQQQEPTQLAHDRTQTQLRAEILYRGIHSTLNTGKLLELNASNQVAHQSVAAALLDARHVRTTKLKKNTQVLPIQFTTTRSSASLDTVERIVFSPRALEALQWRGANEQWSLVVTTFVASRIPVESDTIGDDSRVTCLATIDDLLQIRCTSSFDKCVAPAHVHTSSCDGSAPFGQRRGGGSLAAGHHRALARDGHPISFLGPVRESAAGSSLCRGLGGAAAARLDHQPGSGDRHGPVVPADEFVASVADAVDQSLLLSRPIRQGDGRGVQARRRGHGAVVGGPLLRLRGAGPSDRGGG
ncbi:unnamed protein product [Phytophthora fragariaefolia]|uniref:Unnamed protein product n=1 Tax=Phytophthora fragariaefolia TaxID=1490495 RepID=A0A9W6XK17_9STRA|nr:unnamed protein product [Phytophthora fragariaefolia]